MLADAENDAHSIRILKQHGLHGGEVPDADIMRARRAYLGMVSYIDDQVGALLAALEASGQAGNTVILFTSDHGEMLGERGLWFKKTFFEPALRVPLMLHAPGWLVPGRVATLCSLVDLLPTFASLASDGAWDGAVEPTDGADLTAFGAEDDRAVCAELLCEGIKAPIFMIRQGRFKFITGGEDPDLLFDVEADPDERRNLAADPALAGTVADFAAEAARLWDLDALSAQIVLSQQRRLLIRAAHDQGTRPQWDFDAPDTTEDRWFRGEGNYNDWAFDYLPEG
ncbi:MAG: sulfatase-like hydrolase/transferase [Xanthomonadales bacterium]|nr:sulfatase-like hydrolase/transferase [Xanthomonadales bacterium]